MLNARSLRVLGALCLFWALVPCAAALMSRASALASSGIREEDSAPAAAHHTSKDTSNDASNDAINGAGTPDPTRQMTIIVGDRPLSGRVSLPQQRGARLFLPVTAIARALGDQISVAIQSRRVEVRRQTGVLADFNSPLNQVRENGAVILVVSNTADVVFTPDPEDLMLPVEIIAPLLDVSIIVDALTVRITRGKPGSGSVRDGTQHAQWEFHQINYSYNLNMYSASFGHNFLMNSTGRIGDGRFNLTTNLYGSSQKEAVTFQSGSFSFERPNGQKFIAGDFGTGTDLSFMASSVRGAWAQQPFAGMRMTAFAGRAMSNGFAEARLPHEEPELPFTRFQPAYDTSILGSYASFGPSISNPSQTPSTLYSSGFLYFDGPESRGEMLTSGVKYASERHQFIGDMGVGNFSGINQEGVPVSGFAPMLDFSEVFNLSGGIRLQGRFTHIGANFLSPQGSGAFVASTLYSGGVGWRPLDWLGTSLSGMTRTRPGVGQKDNSVTATVSLTPRGQWPTMIFTHTATENSVAGGSSYSLLNATKEFKDLRLFGNFTRIKIARHFDTSTHVVRPPVQPSLNLSVGAMLRLNSDHTLQANQSFGSGGSLSGSIDWMTSSLFTNRVSFGAGFGYSYSPNQMMTTERFLTAIQLPGRHNLQFTYSRTPNGPQMTLQIQGPLLVGRNHDSVVNAPLSEMRSIGSFYGRVYQDVNLNGRFDTGVDLPQARVQIRIDGNYFAETDERGDFRVDNIKAGEHEVYMDLLTVRADLTLLDSARQIAVMRPGRDAVVDFRLVRTGRIRGVVWLDENANGKIDEGEQRMSNVRVLTGSGRDTLTDGDGEFILGDLPPGEHVILLDEKTLPENMKSAIGSVQAIVKAGLETGDVNLPVTPKPQEVKVKRFPSATP